MPQPPIQLHALLKISTAMATTQLRAARSMARALRVSPRTFTTSARYFEASVPSTSKSSTEPTPAPVDENKPAEINQAPNKVGVWSRSQKPRSKAMTGPRFEQTDFDLQVWERQGE